jgi:four helix bundle protein
LHLRTSALIGALPDLRTVKKGPPVANYKDLQVFHKADDMAFQIYKLSEAFSKSELFGLTSQLRRAALSVPTNIVEGYARKSKKEFAQFINIALGFLAETEYLFGFAKRLEYYKHDVAKAEQLISETGKMLWSFYKAL